MTAGTGFDVAMLIGTGRYIPGLGSEGHEILAFQLCAGRIAGALPRGAGVTAPLRGATAIGANGQRLAGLPANSITASEAAEIQAIANRYNTAIDVVGSRAAGQGRNIGTNLPRGKGPGTRSDIDFRIDAAHPQADALIADLQSVGNGAGTVGRRWSTNPATPGGRPTEPPLIRFTPERR